MPNSVYEDPQTCPICGGLSYPTKHCVELGPDKVDAEWQEVVCEFCCTICAQVFWKTVLSWDETKATE